MDDRIRTWAEIDLGAIEHNYRVLSGLYKDSAFVAIVKANAYGHGADAVAARLQRAGCENFAVATVGEAVSLRQSGIVKDILILGYTPIECSGELLEYGITAAVPDLETAKALSEAAVKAGKKLKVHLKTDTGMGRLGFICSKGRDPVEDMAAAMALPGLDVEGIFTHVATSESEDGSYFLQQLSDFKSVIERAEKRSKQKFRKKHCAHSGAVLKYRDSLGLGMDLIRPGIALYGAYPGEDRDVELRPALSLKSRIYRIRDMDRGDSISYGRTFTADRPCRIAVIPIGYGDGLHRVLSNKMSVLVRGQRAPQVGRICMDRCMVDVSEIDGAACGDVVTIIGSDGGSTIEARELADMAGTIDYELFCDLTARVPRVYIG